MRQERSAYLARLGCPGCKNPIDYLALKADLPNSGAHPAEPQHAPAHPMLKCPLTAFPLTPASARSSRSFSAQSYPGHWLVLPLRAAGLQSRYSGALLLEGQRTGRPPLLVERQRKQLEDILDSGPVAYGLDSGVWTSPMIAWVIEEEFGVRYHLGHVRKLLHSLGYSVQRPRRRLARANAWEQDRWHRYTYPNLKKNPKEKLGPDFHRRG